MDEPIISVLCRFVSRITARGLFQYAAQSANYHSGALTWEQRDQFLEALRTGLDTFLRNEQAREQCWTALNEALQTSPASSGDDNRGGAPLSNSKQPVSGKQPVSSKQSARVTLLPIREQNDVVEARTTARHLCAELGFSSTCQTKLATVVSELARNIVSYAAPGQVEFMPMRDVQGQILGLEIIARDYGPGITDVNGVLAGKYRKNGAGTGLLCVKRLSDEFELNTGYLKGTVVRARSYLQPASSRRSASL